MFHRTRRGGHWPSAGQLRFPQGSRKTRRGTGGDKPRPYDKSESVR